MFALPHCEVLRAIYLAPFMQNLTGWVGSACLSAINIATTSSPNVLHCRMCTETSAGAARSTLLLPGRGSDYIWSINTHWLWEALCLFPFSSSPLSPSVSSSPFASLLLAYYSMTFGHNLSSNLSLMLYFNTLFQGLCSLSLYPSVHSFVLDMNSCDISQSVTVGWMYYFM